MSVFGTNTNRFVSGGCITEDYLNTVNFILDRNQNLLREIFLDDEYLYDYEQAASNKKDADKVPIRL